MCIVFHVTFRQNEKEQANLLYRRMYQPLNKIQLANYVADLLNINRSM